MSDAARWKATVHVRGLAPMVTAGNIHDAFLPFGEIADISMPKNEKPNSTEPHRGFAYVEFEDAEDAKEAIDNMDQSEFFGRVLKVTAAKAPKNVNDGLASTTALWEKEGWDAPNGAEGEQQEQGDADISASLDPMQGLEGLDVAGPKPE